MVEVQNALDGGCPESAVAPIAGVIDYTDLLGDLEANGMWTC